MEETLNEILKQLPDYGIKVVGVIAVFIIGKWIAGRIGRGLSKTLTKRDFDVTLTRFFSNIARTLVMVVVVLACLSIFGVQTTSVAAVLGKAGESLHHRRVCRLLRIVGSGPSFVVF